MYYLTATVQQSTRNSLYEIYPGAFQCLDYQYILYWLLTMVNDRQGYVEGEMITSASYIAALLGLNPRKVNTGDILKGFEIATGIELNLSSYSITKRLARTINPKISPKAIEIIKAERKLKKSEKENLVFFVGGEKYTKPRHSERTTQTRKHFFKQTLKENNSIVIDYHKDMRHSYYNIYQDNIDNVIGMVREGEFTDVQKDYYLCALHFLSDNLAPKYEEKSLSSRVFAIGYSLQNIPRWMRKEILKGTYEVDLSSSQLTLAAYLWDIDSVKDVLNSDTSVWEYISKEMEIEFSPEKKTEIKTAVYSTIFGAGTPKVLEALESFSPLEKERFLSVDIIQDLRSRQNIAVEKIERDGGAKTPQGEWVKLAGSPYKTLATVLQAYEKLIIESAYRLASKYDKDMRIISHEHDGLSIQILKDYKTNTSLKKLAKTIRETSAELGIPMSLEIKE